MSTTFIFHHPSFRFYGNEIKKEKAKSISKSLHKVIPLAILDSFSQKIYSKRLVIWLSISHIPNFARHMKLAISLAKLSLPPSPLFTLFVSLPPISLIPPNVPGTLHITRVCFQDTVQFMSFIYKDFEGFFLF